MAMSQLVGQWHARTRLFPEYLVSREISADDELLTTGDNPPSCDHFSRHGD